MGRKRVIDQLAADDGMEPRAWLIGQLHMVEWVPGDAAKRIGISSSLVVAEMRRLDIPTLADYLAVRYRGRWGSVTDHARRRGVSVTTAVRRYKEGYPLYVVFSPTGYAPRNPNYYTDKAKRQKRVIKLLLDNPHHTLETLKPYLDRAGL